MKRPITTTAARAAILSALLIASVPVALAESPEPIDLTETFRQHGAAVDRLQVYEIAGVVIIRGRTASKESAEEINRLARNLGYTRVANLIQIARHDDERISREAEVGLANHRSLDGCQFRVRSQQGVVSIAGRVRHELQKDVALQLLRQIDGVLAVEVLLKRF